VKPHERLLVIVPSKNINLMENGPLKYLLLPKFFLQNKWLGSEADHSSSSRAKLRMCGAIPPLPHMSSWSGS
jgi:hypothetical protein